MKIPSIHLIDDSEDEVFLAGLLFESQGIELEIVHHEDFAVFKNTIRLHGINQDSVILVDMNMPKMRGDHVVRQLLELDGLGDIVVGMCSGSEDPADRKAAIDAGAAFFTRKPIDMVCLQSICEQVPTLDLVRENGGSIGLSLNQA